MNRSFDNFQRALLRFEEALQLPEPSTLSIDGAIQRFEFTFEAAWKAMRYLLFVTGGIEAPFPRYVLRKAYSAGWIEDEQLWLNMLTDRNETSHIYDEAKANEIYRKFPAYAAALRGLCLRLQPLFSEIPPAKL